MEKFEVGKVISEYIGHSEGCLFDLSNSGANLICFFQDPRETEINQFKAEKTFEIRFTELKNVIMLTFKIGNLSWMDAPYTPHLSKHLSGLTIPTEQEGLSLTLMLVDCTTGKLESLRLIGLGHRFTAQLFTAVAKAKSLDFSVAEYTKNLNEIYAKYSTKNLVKLSSCYYKLN